MVFNLPDDIALAFAQRVFAESTFVPPDPKPKRRNRDETRLMLIRRKQRDQLSEADDDVITNNAGSGNTGNPDPHQAEDDDDDRDEDERLAGVYYPSPEEIAAATAEIRAGWSEFERQRRLDADCERHWRRSEKSALTPEQIRERRRRRARRYLALYAPLRKRKAGGR